MSSALEKLKPVDQSRSASERVVERLTDLISSGNIRPGEKLPSENELSKALQVSRPVVREALRGLMMMGVLETKQGGRCYVTDLEPNRLMAPVSFMLSLKDYDLGSIFRARDVIDGGIAAEAARNATDSQIDKLQELAKAGHRLAEDPVGFRVMDAEFHELVRIAANNDFLDHVSHALYSLALDLRRKATMMAGVLAQSALDHAAIVDAIARHDADAAREAMLAHIANIRRTTFLASESAGSTSRRDV